MAAGRACLIVSLTALFVLGMKEAVIPMAQAQAQTDATGGVHESEAVRIAEFRQLFIDDRVVDRMEGVTRVVNQPEKHPANPLVKLDRPWEGVFQVGGWGSVIYDTSEGLFKMWYCAYPKPEGGIMCYAFSKDGILWEKPDLGIAERNGSTANNVVPNLRSLSTIFSPDDPDPNKRFKAFNGFQGTFSSDGLHWNTLGSERIPGPVAGDGVITFCFDPLTDQYVAAAKVVTGSTPRQRRSVAIALSKDFLTWSEPEVVLEPDARDDELDRERIAAMRDEVAYMGPAEWQIAQFYGMIPFPYEGMYIGMLQVLDVAAPHPVTSTNEAEFLVGGGGEDGLCHIQLASSRDVVHWNRVADRQVFLPQGPPSAWDAGVVYTYCPPIVVGDELWIYYTSEGVSHCSPWYRVSDKRLTRASDAGESAAAEWYRESPEETPVVYRIGTKGPTGGVGLARLRLDGWVSIDAGPAGGTLTTKPIVFEDKAKRLVINAHALEGGWIVVEILDESGKTLSGFGKDDCCAFQHDALRHVVVWDGRSDVSQLAGKPIRLRFHLRNARLYSFVFAP